MKEGAKSKSVLILTIVYSIFFMVLAWTNKNFEFIFYILFEAALLILLIIFYKKIHLPFTFIILFSILLFMHFAGGNIYIDGTRLYDFKFREIIRYDNLVHTLWAFVFALLVYSFLLHHLDKNLRKNLPFMVILLILITTGAGAFVEIVEFLAVIIFKTAGVGDYLNNALDLVYNSLGAVIAAIFILRCHEKLNL